MLVVRKDFSRSLITRYGQPRLSATIITAQAALALAIAASLFPTLPDLSGSRLMIGIALTTACVVTGLFAPFLAIGILKGTETCAVGEEARREGALMRKLLLVVGVAYLLVILLNLLDGVVAIRDILVIGYIGCALLDRHLRCAVDVPSTVG